MRKNIVFAVPLMVAVLISACADSGNDNNNTPPPAKSYNITGKIDYAGKTISSAKVCLDVNNNGMADDNACVDTSDGKYTFTSSNNPAYYPLVAFIKEDTSAAVNAKIIVDNSDYDSILYAPRGKTETISIATTLAKSLMDKNSALKLTDAETKAEAIVKKAESPATVLTVYNNALNTSTGTITDISTSIRGLVNVITDKLNKEASITDKTTITVSQEEVNTANDEISKVDEEQPQEPQEPENPSDEPATPLEQISEMLAGAEIKNSAESPVDLNKHIDMTITLFQNEIGISKDAFGKFAGFESEFIFAGGGLPFKVGYKETNWPSNSELGFDVRPQGAFDSSGIPIESKNRYSFINFTSGTSNNPCIAGRVDGIYYKAIIDDATISTIESGVEECIIRDIGFDEEGQLNDIGATTMCYAKTYYQNRDKFKIEKWYWTIDTTKVDMCSN